MGSGDKSYILKSTDGGITWSRIQPGFQTNLVDVIFTGSTFVAIGQPDTGNSFIISSSDGGNTWEGYTEPSDEPWTNIAYGQDQYIMLQGGSISSSYGTQDLTNYTTASFGSSYIINNLKFLNGRFMALTRLSNEILLAEFIS